MPSVPYATLEQMIKRIHPGDTLVHAEATAGGGSAQVISLHVKHAGSDSTRQYLLRIHSENNRWRNPQIARHEFDVLRVLHDSGLPVAEPYALDESGEIYPIPYVIVSYIEGATLFLPPDLPDFVRQCAELLAKIHRVQPLAALDFLSKRHEHVLWWINFQPEALDETLQEGRLRAALPKIFPLQQMNAPVFLHGDFWAGNLIWQNQRLAGVIDWEDAETGDPLSDLAIARLDLLFGFGQQAMHDFTRIYQALMPALDYRNLPAWDLFSALRPAGQLSDEAWHDSGRPDVTLDTMRQAHRWFVQQAFDRLP